MSFQSIREAPDRTLFLSIRQILAMALSAAETFGIEKGYIKERLFTPKSKQEAPADWTYTSTISK